MIEHKGVPSEKVTSYIMEHAPFIRLIAMNLPNDLKDSWEKAEADDRARTQLESRYEEFYIAINEFIDERFDPETQTALVDAIERGDTGVVASILEAHLALSQRAKEE
jgi:predicted transcriptional regulator